MMGIASESRREQEVGVGWDDRVSSTRTGRAQTVRGRSWAWALRALGEL